MSGTINYTYQSNHRPNLNWCEYNQKNKPQGNAVSTGNKINLVNKRNQRKYFVSFMYYL